MILRARWVLPVGSPPIDNGTVEVAADRIVAVGAARAADRDLGEVVLAPGLINAHCHFDYRTAVPYRGCFADWLMRLVEQKQQQPTDYRAHLLAGIADSLASGTTTVVNIESFPELIAGLPATPLRVIWCRELLDLRAPVPDAALDFDGWLAPHAPYTASAELYRRCARTGKFLTTHLAETEEEDEMFRWGRGPMFETFRKLGRDMSDCRRVGPVRLLHDCGVLGPRCLAAHANVLTAADVALLRDSGTSVVHCPLSHRYFQRGRPRLEQWMSCGINVCLGTDSLASNDRLDMFAEMQEVARQFPRWSAEEILRLATIRAARAIGRAGQLGELRPGAAADLMAVPLAGHRDPYEAVVFAEPPVCYMMIGGKVVRE